MVNSRSKKSVSVRKPRGKSFPKSLNEGPIPLDPAQELKNGDPLDVTEEMMENVFDREPESR